ncbi:LEAF RUST 10 DISEASE-RESISTANCE LOCUS RECEPTOR-LIKE PROTEIN KINASE-like 2.1 [Neltuma alba]|uniref:LEAF RUST 10 DISEASE-RESISTANCE LOCUS RECEPTOR-LIKE PROTEIN KINASE-like 2.1 n=1 Tax=Neltuma alba TaxID=207710 RepID=UPI0010A40283|nr:LEAF RUST 10 DISEASE-RESISTANCE LOCUS RECEPTOR-LIKE PROTEIN KINASE-like 2.1 [Prosopis alba]
MGRGKIGLTGLWGLMLFTCVYLTPQTMGSKNESKTCNPSHCGIITNISYPFRLRGDPPNCGLGPYELACENNVALLRLNPAGTATYQVLRINYDNYTIRVKDPGIREDDCSSLPRYTLSLSNFTYTSNSSLEYDKDNPYDAFLGGSPAFHHVIYLNCSDPVRDAAGYVDTAPCVDWGAKGEGGGHVYVVAGRDLEAQRLKPECRVKSVAAIALDWSSFLDQRSYFYADIHRVLSYGFEISWWRLGCSDLSCRVDSEGCWLRNNQVYCEVYAELANCQPHVLPFHLFCGMAQYLSKRVKGLSSSKRINQFAKEYLRQKSLDSKPGDKVDGHFISFTLGKITAYVTPAIILRFLVGIVFLFILLIYTYRRRHLSGYGSIEDFIQLHNLHPIRYSYKQLKTMTKGFKTKLGEGGFGTVYKGKLRSGPDVAIKMLGNKSKASCQDFINEVATVGRIRHFNVVRLVGFCVEGTKRALIYEFMSNGSLDKHIFFQEGSVSLSYRKIYEISLGVTRGIAYLHHGCDMQILHFDIKPHNILLDDNLTPKISDFGLAKLYVIDDSIPTLTAARGTIGYIAPELFYKNIGRVSHKSDVYSFGMLLMEMASQRRNLNPHAEHSSQLYFPSWIYDQFDEEKDIEIMDDMTEEEKALAKKMFIVALWCIQFNPADRPSMNKVIEMLEVDDVSSLEMPPKPSLYPANDRPNCDETSSLSFTCSHSNLCEDASDMQE